MALAHTAAAIRVAKTWMDTPVNVDNFPEREQGGVLGYFVDAGEEGKAEVYVDQRTWGTLVWCFSRNGWFPTRLSQKH
jgi:hypothetical protein